MVSFVLLAKVISIFSKPEDFSYRISCNASAALRAYPGSGLFPSYLIKFLGATATPWGASQ
tara:strand:+ start:890 stop:1072 length:183 start_codon:yes stop_codon:yes gene_type:complete